MLTLVPITKENVKNLKVGSVFIERGKVKVVLKIEKRKDYPSDEYIVSKGVDYKKFGNTMIQFAEEMKKHSELKEVQYLYIDEDFIFGCYKVTAQ